VIEVWEPCLGVVGLGRVKFLALWSACSVSKILMLEPNHKLLCGSGMAFKDIILVRGFLNKMSRIAG